MPAQAVAPGYTPREASTLYCKASRPIASGMWLRKGAIIIRLGYLEHILDLLYGLELF